MSFLRKGLDGQINRVKVIDNANNVESYITCGKLNQNFKDRLRSCDGVRVKRFRWTNKQS